MGVRRCASIVRAVSRYGISSTTRSGSRSIGTRPRFMQMIHRSKYLRLVRARRKTARLWTYVRDDRPAGLDTHPAVWFSYSPDRKGEHPRKHLRDFGSTLQADAYAGFHHVYEGGKIHEAACWAHVRRKVYDIQAATGSAIAAEAGGAVERIGALYEIERALPMLGILSLLSIIFPVVAAVKANNGVVWKYPLAIPFLKTSTTVI